jgi:trans-aconitate methyltransferase
MSDKSHDDQTTADKQWDAAAYDSKHSFVWKYGEGIIEMLAPRRGERILDLGCGTGHLTHKIASSGAEVVGIDKSREMIEQARQNYPNITFEVADGAAFEFDDPFDAVFSNAVLHWIREPGRVVACVWRALKPGGRFVAEFGGKGNLSSIHGAIYDAIEKAGYEISREDNFRFYPTVGEYASLLERQGFRVSYAAHFDRPTLLEEGERGLENWMEVFANNFFNSVPESSRSRIIREVEDRVRPKLYYDGAWHADYRRLRVVAEKSDAAG